MNEDKQVPMFDAEYRKLQEVHQKVVSVITEKCGGNPPPVVRIIGDYLNIVGMSLQQLEGYVVFIESAAGKAAADLAAGGKGVVNG